MLGNVGVNLDEYLEEQIEPEEGFKIDDLDKAEWAVRKIACYETSIKEAEELAKKRLRQIDTWLKGIKEDNERQIKFFEELLRPFAEFKLEGSKKRSMKLPCGTLGFRKSQPKYERDEDKLLAWVKDSSPEHLVIKESVNWSSLKKSLVTDNGKAITCDGEIVTGITVEEQPDTFYVKVGE